MKVVHVIDSIGVGGGAEKIVADTINAMDGVSHTLITLYTYPDEYVLKSTASRKNIGCTSLLSVPAALLRLRKLIRAENADVIHAHLFWSALLCKLVRPRRARLLVTVHSMWGIEIFQRSRMLLWLEKRLAHRQHALTAVSGVALQSYLQYIPFKGTTHTVYNFVNDRFFRTSPQITAPSDQPFKCVAVGHFKPAKDYFYLLQCFFLMRQDGVVLDIYGEGPLQKDMQQFIDKHRLDNVRLKGVRSDMHTVLPGYDAFLSASLHEGFGLALAEAMASALPCVVSDIPAHREVGGDACIYINKQEGELKRALLALRQNPSAANDHASRARERAAQIANKDNYLTAVRHVYDSLISA